jgi:hypothetical protein
MSSGRPSPEAIVMATSETHEPFSQTAPPPQLFPHVPQCALLLGRYSQSPFPQSVQPGAHRVTHVPALHSA